MNNHKVGDLRVWHIPQIPGTPFFVDVNNVEEAKRVIDILARYDMFQFENNIKPDYINMSGLVVFEDLGDGSFDWCEWADPDTGEGIDDVLNE